MTACQGCGTDAVCHPIDLKDGRVLTVCSECSVKIKIVLTRVPTDPPCHYSDPGDGHLCGLGDFWTECRGRCVTYTPEPKGG